MPHWREAPPIQMIDAEGLKTELGIHIADLQAVSLIEPALSFSIPERVSLGAQP